MVEYTIDSGIDIQVLKRDFERNGRVFVPHLLSNESAEVLYACVNAEAQWSLNLYAEGRPRVADPKARERGGEELERSTRDAAYVSARSGYAYLHESFDPADHTHQGGHACRALSAFADWLGEAVFLEFCRSIASDPGFDHAVCTVRRLRPGDFGGAHIDSERRYFHLGALWKRRLAFVYYLTSAWRSEWGGLLAFSDYRGKIEEAHVPRYDSMSIFLASQLHEVTYVSPLAAEPRTAIGGFLMGDRELRGRAQIEHLKSFGRF